MALRGAGAAGVRHPHDRQGRWHRRGSPPSRSSGSLAPQGFATLTIVRVAGTAGVRHPHDRQGRWHRRCSPPSRSSGSLAPQGFATLTTARVAGAGAPTIAATPPHDAGHDAQPFTESPTPNRRLNLLNTRTRPRLLSRRAPRSGAPRALTPPTTPATPAARSPPPAGEPSPSALPMLPAPGARIPTTSAGVGPARGGSGSSSWELRSAPRARDGRRSTDAQRPPVRDEPGRAVPRG
jgi:hypothetical protein